jgi:acetyltransferase-like isoleucine patch superfamily enzyme
MMVRIEKYKDLQAEENVELIIGPGCGFNGMRIHNDGAIKCATRPTVRIGCNLHSGKGCIIRTSDHDYSRGYPIIHGAIAGYKCADVTIGDHVWLGDEVLVMKGVTIFLKALNLLELKKS